MRTGLVWFVLLFVVLPLVGLAAVAFLPSAQLLLALGALTLLSVGYVMGIAFLDLE